MKKTVRLVSLMTLCIAVIVLVTGCGGGKDDSILEKKTTALEQNMRAYVYELEEFRGLSDSQIDEYVNTIEEYKKSGKITEDQAKMSEEVVKSWHEIEGELGRFQSYGDFEFDPAGKTYTATQYINYQNREVQLVYTVSKSDFEITGANVEIVYSLGEKMSKAAGNTVMGICIVFAMLVLMCVVIYAFNIISYVQNKLNRKKEEKKIEITGLEFEGEEDEETEVADNKELIAVIAAAIAASTGKSTDDFVVRSIRRRS